MRKFLVIRFSSIGDIVLTTPVVRCLKNQIPDAEIHYLTKEVYKPILSANPFIDKIYTINDKISEVLPELKKENYNQLIDLHKNFRSAGVILNLRKPNSSFDKINFQKWLMVRFKINKLPDFHIADRYFQAVTNLDVKNDMVGLDYFIPENDEINLQSLAGLNDKNYIAWAIGGKHNTKIFPEDKIIDVIGKTHKTFVLLGGMEDCDKGERIRMKAAEKVFNGCGKFSINQSASMVRQAQKVITNDTGMMHIAAAFKKPIISLWGNTIPEFGMYPYMPGNEENSKILEVNGLSCRPCSKLGFDKCPKGHFKCMNDIQTETIVNLILAF